MLGQALKIHGEYDTYNEPKFQTRCCLHKAQPIKDFKRVSLCENDHSALHCGVYLTSTDFLVKEVNVVPIIYFVSHV